MLSLFLHFGHGHGQICWLVGLAPKHDEGDECGEVVQEKDLAIQRVGRAVYRFKSMSGNVSEVWMKSVSGMIVVSGVQKFRRRWGYAVAVRLGK